MHLKIKPITFFLFFIVQNLYSQVTFTIKQVGLGKDSLHQIIIGNFMEVVPKKVNDSILEYVFFPTKPEYLFVVNDIPTRWETRVWIDNKMGNKGLIIDYKNRTTNIINENEWDIVTKKVLEFKDSKRYTESDSLIKRYIDKNSNSYLSLWLLGFMHNKSNQLVMLDKLSSELKEYPEYKHLKANLLDRKYPNIGDAFKEFTLKDRNDLVFNSNSVKSKFVLLHFWSNGCGPCVREMDNFVSFYNSLDTSKIALISVALDEDRNKWKDALTTNKIKWTSVWEAEAGFGPLCLNYNLRSMPFFIFFDREKKIIFFKDGSDELENIKTTFKEMNLMR
jgi:thiol-disulfide isomerase/thioredoxin